MNFDKLTIELYFFLIYLIPTKFQENQILIALSSTTV